MQRIIHFLFRSWYVLDSLEDRIYVLVSVAKTLRDMTSADNGELAARYGGEEFMRILKAGSFDEAHARVREVVRRIFELRWEEHPTLCTSVSGGFIACKDHPNLTEALHVVDALLYQAKDAGKNNVCVGHLGSIPPINASGSLGDTPQ